MLTGLLIGLIIVGFIYVVGMIIYGILYLLGGASFLIFGAILNNKITRIILSSALLLLGLWLCYECFIEEEYHWAWGAFIGVPLSLFNMYQIYPSRITYIVIFCILMGIGGYLAYSAWIEDEIHWAWAAFIGVPLVLIGMAGLSLSGKIESFKALDLFELD